MTKVTPAEKVSGIVCPVPRCHSTRIKVMDTHVSLRYCLIVRTRKCLDCGCKFHTEEKTIQMGLT